MEFRRVLFRSGGLNSKTTETRNAVRAGGEGAAVPEGTGGVVGPNPTAKTVSASPGRAAPCERLPSWRNIMGWHVTEPPGLAEANIVSQELRIWNLLPLVPRLSCSPATPFSTTVAVR